MRIDRVILSNVGPHERLEVNFGAGIIGVVGANGSGKSTLINAIYAALTGDFSRLGDTKADAIYNNANGKSYVEVYGTHGGKSFAVHRGLKPNKTTMSFGDVEINMTRAANEELLLRLGVPKLIIDHYVFVDQWKMFGFLDQRESERAKVMQYLCRTEKAEQIYKAATAFVARHAASQIIDNSVELTQLADEQKAQLNAAGEKLDRLRSECPSSSICEVWEQLVNDYRELSRAVSEEETARRERQEARKRQAQSATKVRAAQATHAELQAVADEWQKKSDKAKAIRSKLVPIAELQEDQNIAEARHVIIQTRAATAATNLARHTDIPSSDELRERREAAAYKLAVLAEKRKDLKADISHVSEDMGSRRCSRCRQPVSAEIAESWSQELAGIDREMLTLDSERKWLNEIDRDLVESEAANTQLENSTSSLDKVRRQLSQLGAGSFTVTIEQCDKAISTAKRHAKTVADALSELNASLVSSARCEGQVKAARERSTAAKAQVELLQKALSGAKEEATVKARLSQAKTLQQQVKIEESNVQNLKQQVGATLAAVDQLRARIATHRQRQARVELIADVADVFHWQRLPKQVAQDNLARLVFDINSTLELFRDPFTVAATEDLMFDVFFPGKPAVKATQLSGGQKVVLAVAFRMALDRLFGTDVGMLFLDEPTAGLDADNVAYFHEALQVLSARMEGQRQVVVITHVHEFSDRFDSVVEITTR